MRQRSCTFLNPCPEDIGFRSNYSQSDRFESLWRPLFPDTTISACSCGCIYIVGRRRTVKITSSSDCASKPKDTIKWTVKVRNTIRVATMGIVITARALPHE